LALKVLLRIGGTILTSAFLTTLLPVEWMSSTHAQLGLGTFPRTPVVDYLTRTVAALYGFHGLLLFIVSRDPVRHREIVTYLVFMNITFGAMLIAIDLHAGLPEWWTFAEGPFVIAMGILIWILKSEAAHTRTDGSAR